MLKSIMIPATGMTTGDAAMKQGVKLGKAFSAHIRFLFVAPDPRMAVPFVGEGLTAEVIQDLCQNAEAESDRQTCEARATADEICKSHEVAVMTGTDGANMSFDCVTGAVSEFVGRRGRMADLSVVPAPNKANDPDARDMIEDLLFRSGRALLMVPDGWEADIGRHVVVAWNGRAEGARAVSAALPMLSVAQKVTLLQVGPSDVDRPGLDDLASWLGDHKIDVTCERRNKGDRGVGEGIIRSAEDLGGDMLVIGAYSHSRWREMVLGGVTEHIVANATMPVFMSH